MLFALVILLMLLMVLVGGERGVKSFIALCGNVGVLLLCVYLIALGAPPLLTAVFCAALFSAITLIYQSGSCLKTYCAMAAMAAVLCLTAIPALIVTYGANAAGYSELDRYEEASMYLSANVSIDMRALFCAVLLFGMLGAVMDAAISISSALTEIDRNNPALTRAQLIASGRAVGRDILGTTVNTLFFAGIGETMMQAILFLKNGYDFETLVNSKAFLQELSLILIANLGCLIVIPAVTLITSHALKAERGFFARMPR